VFQPAPPHFSPASPPCYHLAVGTDEPLLDESTAAFVEGGVSIIASSCDGRGGLSVVRALGCRVSSDRKTVTVLVPSPHPLLDGVQSSGRIAVAFTRPSTHQALQLKGEDARLSRRLEGDAQLNERYVRAFVSDVCPLGFTEELIRALTWSETESLQAVAFRPTAAFNQTPGPRAGAPLTP
jgi:hypothetical protein